MKKETRATKRLEQRRREAQARFEDLRQALDREIGWVPRHLWWLPVVGFACGLALSAAVGTRRSRAASSNE